MARKNCAEGECERQDLMRAIESLTTSLREMLDCYWGEGDGETPPEFIQRAQQLVAKYGKQSD
jgi:hypothetical protein